jgi:Protein of unknown function (DUF4065)
MVRAATRVEDQTKLGELIVHISQRSAKDPRFGATKLNKLLYFSDFLAYGNYGKPITSATYRHLKNGPAPKYLEEVRDVLIKDGAIKVETVQLKSGRRQIRTVAKRKPVLANFTKEEIGLVNFLIHAHWEKTADEISDHSHNYVGWKMTKENETIPYESIFLSDAPLTTEEIYRGQELAREYGWVEAEEW